MEQKLSRLLDYQRFAQNSRLSGIIADVESRYAGALSDDDLELVSAAGSTTPLTVRIAPLKARHDIPDDEERES